MTTATIDGAESAIFAALGALVTAGKAATAERFACASGRMTTSEILAMCGGKSPALLLMQDRGVVEDTVRTTSGAGAESIDHVDWLVLLVIVDTRQPKQGLKGTTGLKGLYPLQNDVYSVLNGLEIAGLYQTSSLHSRGHSWGLTEPGKVYVNVMRFTSDVELPVAALADTSVTMTEMDLNLNIGGETAPPGKPFAPIKVDTTE